MAREIKDEIQGGSIPTEGQPISSEPPVPSAPTATVQLAITESLQKQLVDIVMEDWESSKVARGKKDFGLDSKGGKLDFDKWLSGLKDLYNGRREPKDIPWKYCSNRGLRMATSILDMIHSRMVPAIINDELLRWRPGESTDQPKVERISKLMHWWIWVRSKMHSFFDIWVKQSAGYGDSLTESYWKVVPIDRGRMIEQPIVGEDGNQLVNQDGTLAVSKQKQIDKIESTASKVYPPEDIFLQECSKDILTEPVILKDRFLYRELEQDEMEGKFVNISTKLREQIQWKKPEMANMNEAELEKLKSIKIRNEPVEILKWFGNFDAGGDGFAEDVRIVISPVHKIYLGGMSMRDITYSGKRPLDFTKFDNRLVNPDENWGEGVLEKVRELSEEIDAIFNQLTDSNTIGVLRPFFYDPGGDVDAPVLKLGPNKGTPVSDPTRNVFFPDIRIQTDQLILAIRLVLEFIERLTAASSYVLGKESEIVGGSGTATRTNAIVQSAEQRFAMPSERLRAGAARIVTNHLDLLQLNIPMGLENRVLGEDMKPIFEGNELSQEGISGEFDAYILADPSMGSKQTERDLSSMIYSVLLQNVIVGTDPVKIYKVTADLLKAYGKDPEEYLGPEPTGDNIDDPEDENTLIIQGDFERVRAQITENHILHIQKHQELLESPSLAEIANRAPHLYQQIIQYIQIHIQEHMQQMQIMQQLMAKIGGGGGKSGNAGSGLQNSGSEGNGEPSSMETVPGPLGQAMQDKRSGEVQSPAF